MSAFNLGGRRIRIMGTKGMIDANAWDPIVKIQNFCTKKVEEIDINNSVLGDSIVSGHGGGDSGIMSLLYDVLCGNASADDLSNISVSVKSHTIVFAAEQSRIEGRVVELSEFYR